MKKTILTTAFAAAALVGVSAQKSESAAASSSWINNVKLSGYALTQYQADFGNSSSKAENSFNIRMLRLAVDGRVASDFYWKAQLQFNGNTSTLGNSPRMVDLFAEWQRYDFVRIKAGQFKRPFTFENPMNPIDQGFMSYAQGVSKLAGFSDRSGSHASNGRDIGVQLQGDLLKAPSSGRPLLHYQVGIYNGQGINTKDVDQQKDLIGGLWVMPVKGMRIGAFGWTGSYARRGNILDGQQLPDSRLRRLQQRRYALSAEYKPGDWTLRAEYIHSTGYGFKTTYQKESDAKDITVNTAAGSRADGAYALVIAPVVSKRLYAKARYDFYRPRAEWGSMKTYYEAGLNLLLTRNLQINAEYALVNDRTLAHPNRSMADVQLDIRF